MQIKESYPFQLLAQNVVLISSEDLVVYQGIIISLAPD